MYILEHLYVYLGYPYINEINITVVDNNSCYFLSISHTYTGVGHIIINLPHVDKA